jgi:hypothetical protein
MSRWLNTAIGRPARAGGTGEAAAQPALHAHRPAALGGGLGLRIPGASGGDQRRQAQGQVLLQQDTQDSQRLPAQGEGNLAASGWQRGDEDQIGRNEDFRRIALLSATLTPDELLGLEPEAILRRLFWEERVRVFEPQRPRFACTCSRARVAGMLRGLGRAEIDSLIAERGEAEVSCDFCGQQYRFDAVDVGELFTPAQHAAGGSDALN